MKKKHIIIGASAGGIAAGQRLRQLLPHDDITLFGAEEIDPYNKCLLIDLCSDQKNSDQITIFNHKKASDQNIIYKKGISIRDIDRQNRQVVDHGGNYYGYDSLVLATGSCPVIPPVLHEVEADNLFYIHTKHDIMRLKQFLTCNRPKTALILGAGITGLEYADFLINKGLTVSVIEQKSHLLPGYVHPQVADYIEHELFSGILFVYNTTLTAITLVNNLVRSVSVSSHADMQADIYIIATGARPNSILAQKAGLKTYENGAVEVDAYFRTSDMNIYAVGDLIMTPLKGRNAMIKSFLWSDAVIQGLGASQSIAGVESIPYVGIEFRLQAHLAKKSICIYGETSLGDPMVHIRGSQDKYHSFFFVKDDILKGFVLVGDLRKASIYKSMVRQEIVFDPSTIDLYT